MSRDEYLQKANEGFIKDTLKKGWEKIKSVFKIGMKKIKGFITIFDTEGNAYPVVSPQAVIDKFSGSDAVKVYAPSEMSDSVVAAGGNGCDEKAPLRDDDESYDDAPGPDSIEYRNFLRIPQLLKENFDLSDEESKKLFEDMVGESWEGIKKARVDYLDTTGELSPLKVINSEQFEKFLDRMIDQRITKGGKIVKREDGVKSSLIRNVLVFGAPGIGKSTIPNQVIAKYNSDDKREDKDKISLIDINCALIAEGDLIMPTMPKEIDITHEIEDFKEVYPESAEYIGSLTRQERDNLIMSIKQSGQFKSSDAPKSWLPSYRKTGNTKLDRMLNEYANGGVYTVNDEEMGEETTYKTGSGGIILLDEFLRANEGVFDQLMNFFLTRRIQDWQLGSKWCIIACSNRPSDDKKVSDVWKSWNDSPASKDRFAYMFQMKPDKDLWIKYMRKQGFDQLFIDFIFDPKSMAGDEYPRWHSAVRRGTGESKQVEPISPRRWEEINKAVSNYKIEHDIKDISEIDPSEFDSEELMGGIVDDSFIQEFKTWLEDHRYAVDLDAIMKNPKEVYLQKVYTKDRKKGKILIDNLLTSIKERFKDNPEKITEDQLANIAIWLGINYKGDWFEVKNLFNRLEVEVFKDKTDYRMSNYPKLLQVGMAAYPESDIFDDIDDIMHSSEPWPGVKDTKEAIELVKDYMREYFPWRINDDGSVNFYDALSIDDDEEPEE